MQIKRQSFAFSLTSGTATTPSFEEVPLTEAELDDETSRRRPSLLNVPTIVTTKTVLRRLSSLVLPPENPPLSHCIIEDDDDTDGNCARSCSPLDNNSLGLICLTKAQITDMLLLAVLDAVLDLLLVRP